MGILFGLLAALLNSFGYLFSAQFIFKYKSPMQLLVLGQVCMMALAVGFLPWLFPFGALQSALELALLVVVWVLLFCVGQGLFFCAQKYFESSRLSSLLGLKIIVLALMFMLSGQGMLNGLQWLAVLVAALAAMTFNWSGVGKTTVAGWLCLLVTLVCYSSADLCENRLIQMVAQAGAGPVRSCFATAALLYSVLGFLSLPLLLKYRPSLPKLRIALPYAGLWLLSQVALFGCFTLVAPVFGNVILATRGIFSVVFGVLLPLVGLGQLDSKISARKWVQRAVGALLMLIAIGLYSWGRTLQAG